MQHPPIDYNRKWLVMSAVAMGIFLGTIDGSIVNVALPTLVADLQTNFATVQWVVLALSASLGSDDGHCRAGLDLDRPRLRLCRHGNRRRCYRSPTRATSRRSARYLLQHCLCHYRRVGAGHLGLCTGAGHASGA